MSDVPGIDAAAGEDEGLKVLSNPSHLHEHWVGGVSIVALGVAVEQPYGFLPPHEPSLESSVFDESIEGPET